jgi:GNAT superfamily N-acetyltransferase
MTPAPGNPVIFTGCHAGVLAEFLLPRAESSMILLSNLNSAGLDDRGETFHGTYAGYISNGRISGVAAHYRNGMVFLQAPEGSTALVRAAIEASGRPLAGLAGPFHQVQEVVSGLGLQNRSPVMNSRDTLYMLSLDSLVVPEPLRQGTVTCRHPFDDEIPALIRWRTAYAREITGTPNSSIEREAPEMIEHLQKTARHWVLEKEATIIATAACSAQVPGMVQIGGVYTVPAYRNHGYGRSVVAGSLLELRDHGVKKAVLFTGDTMPAARASYTALGFVPVGEYGLVIL